MLGGMGQIAILIFVHVLNHESTAFGNIHGTASEQTLQQISTIDVPTSAASRGQDNTSFQPEKLFESMEFDFQSLNLEFAL